MWKLARPKIKKGDKLLVGLGCSFVQGVGAYTDETYAKHNYKIDVAVSDKKLIKEQYEGSWVNQLCVNHLLGWIPVNLGHSGTGNRCAVKELYLNPQIPFESASEVIVVLMLSGLERFDFAKKEQNEEHHFEAMWPNPRDPDATNKELWQCYADDLYSHQFIATELLLNLFEVEMICKAQGYKLVVCSAFDRRFDQIWLENQLGRSLIPLRKSYYQQIIDKFDWTRVLYPQGRKTFMELLMDLEGHTDLSMKQGNWFPYYTKLPKPNEYVTNCAHPTRKGHKVIAEELYSFIKAKGYL